MKTLNCYSMSEWNETLLKDICNKIQYGYTASAINKDTGIKFLRITDVANDSLVWETVPYCYISDKEFEKYSLQKNDIVIARTGATVGFAKFINTLPTNCVFASYLIRIKINGEHDSFFWGKLIESKSYKSYIDTIAGGSAQPNANAQDLTSFKFVVPQKNTQKKIAAILTAYDDLIERNNKRIKLLEGMAEELFKEWFVRMRFPGYKVTKFIKGVPEGWEIERMDTFCSKVTDGTHDTPKPSLEGYPLVTGKNIYNGVINFLNSYKISERDHIKISKRSGLKKDDILFSNIGTIGSMAIVTDNINYSVKNVIIFRPKSEYHSLYLYNFLNQKYILEQLSIISSGASQQFISLNVARWFKIFNPGQNLIERYGKIILPVYEKKNNLLEQNLNLTNSREHLLNRLMSSKLSVDNLEIKFPRSMQEETVA